MQTYITVGYIDIDYTKLYDSNNFSNQPDRSISYSTKDIKVVSAQDFYSKGIYKNALILFVRIVHLPDGQSLNPNQSQVFYYIGKNKYTTNSISRKFTYSPLTFDAYGRSSDIIAIENLFGSSSGISGSENQFAVFVSNNRIISTSLVKLASSQNRSDLFVSVTGPFVANENVTLKKNVLIKRDDNQNSVLTLHGNLEINFSNNLSFGVLNNGIQIRSNATLFANNYNINFLRTSDNSSDNLLLPRIEFVRVTNKTQSGSFSGDQQDQQDDNELLLTRIAPTSIRTNDITAANIDSFQILSSSVIINSQLKLEQRVGNNNTVLFNVSFSNPQSNPAPFVSIHRSNPNVTNFNISSAVTLTHNEIFSSKKVGTQKMFEVQNDVIINLTSSVKIENNQVTILKDPRNIIKNFYIFDTVQFKSIPYSDDNYNSNNSNDGNNTSTAYSTYISFSGSNYPLKIKIGGNHQINDNYPLLNIIGDLAINNNISISRRKSYILNSNATNVTIAPGTSIRFDLVDANYQNLIAPYDATTVRLGGPFLSGNTGASYVDTPMYMFTKPFYLDTTKIKFTYKSSLSNYEGASFSHSSVFRIAYDNNNNNYYDDTIFGDYGLIKFSRPEGDFILYRYAPYNKVSVTINNISESEILNKFDHLLLLGSCLINYNDNLNENNYCTNSTFYHVLRYKIRSLYKNSFNINGNTQNLLKKYDYWFDYLKIFITRIHNKVYFSFNGGLRSKNVNEVFNKTNPLFPKDVFEFPIMVIPDYYFSDNGSDVFVDATRFNPSGGSGGTGHYDYDGETGGSGGSGGSGSGNNSFSIRNFTTSNSIRKPFKNYVYYDINQSYFVLCCSYIYKTFLLDSYITGQFESSSTELKNILNNLVEFSDYPYIIDYSIRLDIKHVCLYLFRKEGTLPIATSYRRFAFVLTLRLPFRRINGSLPYFGFYNVSSTGSSSSNYPLYANLDISCTAHWYANNKFVLNSAKFQEI